VQQPEHLNTRVQGGHTEYPGLFGIITVCKLDEHVSMFASGTFPVKSVKRSAFFGTTYQVSNGVQILLESNTVRFKHDQ
jgi:hypothetical protein